MGLALRGWLLFRRRHLARSLFTLQTSVAAIAMIASVAHAGPINEASEAFGLHPDYTQRLAMRESNMRPFAHAPNTSAAGLYQFLASTWLATIKTHGTTLGIQVPSDQWVAIDGGGWTIADPDFRRQILALRYDPAISTAAVALFTRDNADAIRAALGIEPTQDELYLAHFLGANGAIRFLTITRDTPWASAAYHFPRAASKNRALFYDDGRPLNMLETMSRLSLSDIGRPSQSQIALAETFSRANLYSAASFTADDNPDDDLGAPPLTSIKTSNSLTAGGFDQYLGDKVAPAAEAGATNLEALVQAAVEQQKPVTGAEAQHRTLLLIDKIAGSPFAPNFARSVKSFVMPGGAYTDAAASI